MSVVDAKWGIPLLDGVGSDSNDFLCRLSSNSIAESQEHLFWIHLAVMIVFSVLTYAVSKRDILGRTERNSVSQAVQAVEAGRIGPVVLLAGRTLP